MAKVSFTGEISPSAVVRMYEAPGAEPEGRAAVKAHSGGAGSRNFICPGFLRPAMER